MPSEMALCLLGISLLVPIVQGSVEAESWTKLVIPDDYWLPLNSTDEKAYGNRMACAVGCQLMGSTCKGYLFEEARSACSFGDIVPTWSHNNYIPSYVKDGKEISIRKSLLKKNALKNVVHLATMKSEVTDAALERPDLLPSPIPPPIDPPYFTVQSYKNEIIVCGGKLPNNAGDKHCW